MGLLGVGDLGFGVEGFRVETLGFEGLGLRVACFGMSLQVIRGLVSFSRRRFRGARNPKTLNLVLLETWGILELQQPEPQQPGTSAMKSRALPESLAPETPSRNASAPQESPQILRL